MKRLTRLISIALLGVFIVVGVFGCYGNMALTRKVYNFNGSIDNKFVQQIVFWVMNFVPVYGTAAWLDIVVLNTIEFWTGANPLAMADGQESIKYAQSGDSNYEIKVNQNRIRITQVAGANQGSSVDLNFDPITKSWFLTDNGVSQKIASLDGDNLNLIYPSGKELAIHLAK